MCRAYNGYKDKATWLIQLWLTNDAVGYNQWLQFKSAEEIKEFVENQVFQGIQPASLRTDLLQWSIAIADYYKLWDACKEAQEDLTKNKQFFLSAIGKEKTS